MISLDPHFRETTWWQDNPANRIDPWDGFDDYKWQNEFLGDLINAETGPLQDYNQISYHVHVFYRVPIDEIIECKKRRGIKWMRVRNMEFSCSSDGIITMRYKI